MYKTIRKPHPNTHFSRRKIIFTLSAIALSLSTIQAQALTIDGTTVIVPIDRPTPWDINNELIVGGTTTGALMINSGSSASAIRLTVGNAAGSEGKVTVDGAGSSFSTTTGSIRVGDSGAGTLDILNGGQVTSNMISLGVNAGSTGTVNIDGNGSVLTLTGSASNALGVGFSGTGILNILNGGTLITIRSNTLANSAGSTGIVTVDGVGSTWQASEKLEIGHIGTGILNIQNGGTVTSGGGGYDVIGVVSGSNGTVNVTGAGSSRTSSTAGGISVGFQGEGALNIFDGGSVSASSLNISTFYGSTGTVTVAGAGSALSVTGAINVGAGDAGTLTIANQGKVDASSVNVGPNSTLNIGSAAGYGPTAAGELNTATVTFNFNTGKIVFNHTDTNYQFDAAIRGAGNVDLYSGTTVLTGANTYTGATTVNGGTLAAGATNTFSAGSNYTVQTNGTIDLKGYDQTLLSLVNSGQVITGGTTAGTTLNITGNYTGNGGTLVLNTELGDDTSATDQLIVNGDTSGTTTVQINNVNGMGGQTDVGINVISVNGTSGGTFVTDRVVAAGAYEYILAKGGNNGNPDDWYLLSSYVGYNYPSQTPLIRPAAGAYIGMAEFANAAFTHSFHDRQQLVNNEYRSGWVRVDYSEDKSKAYNGYFTTRTNRTLVHIGNDLIEGNNWHLGLMGAYAHGELDTHSSLTGSYAKGSVDGYSLGTYATWMNKDENLQGFYVDLYGQYNWFKSRLHDDGNTASSYRTNGYTLSAETGYSINVGQTNKTQWTLEPQLQLVYNRFDGANFTDVAGAKVHNNNSNDVMTRAGVRLQGQGSEFKPFVTANYWHHTGTPQVTLDDMTVSSNRAKDLLQTKVGGEVALNKNASFYGQLSGTWGVNKETTESYGGNVGVKIRW